MSVLLGDGDANFTPEMDYFVASCSMEPALGDVNGDGTLDLVLAGRSVTTLLLGVGNGTFWCAQSVTAPSFALGLGDMNMDGTLDLALLAGGSAGAAAEVILNTR